MTWTLLQSVKEGSTLVLSGNFSLQPDSNLRGEKKVVEKPCHHMLNDVTRQGGYLEKMENLMAYLICELFLIIPTEGGSL